MAKERFKTQQHLEQAKPSWWALKNKLNYRNVRNVLKIWSTSFLNCLFTLLHLHSESARQFTNPNPLYFKHSSAIDMQYLNNQTHADNKTSCRTVIVFFTLNNYSFTHRNTHSRILLVLHPHSQTHIPHHTKHKSVFDEKVKRKQW